MRLVSLLEHMKNQKVSVNGTEYAIDAEGEAYVGNRADAEALLANAAGWMVKPEPLMPLGEDGKPEHLHVPPKYKTAPLSPQDPLAQARLAQESPVLTPAGPAQSATAGPMGPISPGPFGQGAPQAAPTWVDDREMTPEDLIADIEANRDRVLRDHGAQAPKPGFGDDPISPDDIIRAAEPPRPIAVSSPTAPADARVGAQTKSKKGSRK